MKIFPYLLAENLCLVAVAFWAGRNDSGIRTFDNRRYSEIIKASGKMVFWFSTEERKFWWYGNCDPILDPKDDSRDLESISHPDDFPLLLQQMEDVGRGIVYDIRIRLLDRSGDYRDYRCRMVPVEKKDTKNRNVVGFLEEMKA